MIIIDRNILLNLIQFNISDNIEHSLKKILQISNLHVKYHTTKNLYCYFNTSNQIIVETKSKKHLMSNLKSLKHKVGHEYIHHLQELEFKSNLVLSNHDRPWNLSYERDAYAFEIFIQLFDRVSIEFSIFDIANHIRDNMRSFDYLLKYSSIANITYKCDLYYKMRVLQNIYNWSGII